VAAPQGRRLFEISTDVVDAEKGRISSSSLWGKGETPQSFGFDSGLALAKPVGAGFHPRAA
jgi:hypothetical protein